MNDSCNFKKFDKAVNADNSHFLYVADICRIVKRSGLDDGKDLFFTDSNVPPQKSNTQNCKNDVHFQYAVFAFIE